MSLLDDFNRVVGAGWGTMSSGRDWAQVTLTNAATSVDGAHGVLAGLAGGYAIDERITGAGPWTAPGGFTETTHVRLPPEATALWSFYRTVEGNGQGLVCSLFASGGQFRLEVGDLVNGTTAVVLGAPSYDVGATVKWTWDPSTRLISAKYWLDSDPEPAAWQVSATLPAFSLGAADSQFYQVNWSSGGGPFTMRVDWIDWGFVPTVGSWLGSAPAGLSGAPEYVIEFFNSGSTFGPNTKLGEVWDARNVGWSRYDRLPGKAFLTLAQSSAILPLLTPLTTHVAIWRITPNGDTLVYRGVYIDSNNTGDDVILDCYDYLSLLSISRSGFKTLYPTKKLGTEIVSPEWALAKGATSSPLGFVTTGTVEDPLGTDGVTPIKTNAQFGTLDQTRLQLFYDLTEMGRANTVNQVTYEIDLNNVFNFWKNRGSASSLALVLGGNISDYGYLPGWTRYRNDVATVGMAAAGGATEIVATNAAEITAKGRRQDVTTLKTLAGIGGGATEADQQKAALERDLKRLVQQQSALMLRVARGKVEPFVGYTLNDTALVEISNGNDLITGTRRIVGLRCLFSEAGEDVDLMVAQVAS